jgi:hypothetical protein
MTARGQMHVWRIVLLCLSFAAVSEAAGQMPEEKMWPTRFECPRERSDRALLYESTNRLGNRAVWLIVYGGGKARSVDVFVQSRSSRSFRHTKSYDLEDELDAASRADAQTYTDAADFLKRHYCDGPREALETYRANIKNLRETLENRR